MNEQLIQKLVASGLLTDQNARVAERAGFRCEYCGLNFLESAENYRQWEWDHIVPKKWNGTDDFDNRAAACRTCNVCFKGQWNPGKVASPGASRGELIEVGCQYIAQKKEATLKNYVQRYRDIIQAAAHAAEGQP